MWKVEEDPVVREIPVFMSKELSGQLYVMQFPLTPTNVPFKDDDTTVIQAQVKPLQEKLRITLDINTDVRYSKSKGNALKLAATGKTPQYDDDEDDMNLLTEQVLESMSIPVKSRSKRYVIGVVRNGQLHLSPLKSIVQMQNKLTHLNSADALSKETEEGHEQEAESEATKVTVKFKQTRGAGADPSKSKNPKSYKAQMMRQEEEPWTDLEYFSRNENAEHEKLCGDKKESETPFYVAERNNYLNSLFPKDAGGIVEGYGKKEDRVSAFRASFDQMKSLPFPEQLKGILLKGKLMHHAQVHDLLRSKLKLMNVDEQGLVRSLQIVAVVVQGCWAVKSDLLYPNNFVSDTNGISGSMMQKGRDLILAHFDRGNRFVTRTEMCKLTHLPNAEVTEILMHICRPPVPKQGWEFALPHDSAFLKNNPEVAERQSMTWQAKRNRMLETENPGAS